MLIDSTAKRRLCAHSILFAAMPLLGGCASIVTGQHQSVSVETIGEAGNVGGAQCKLSNNKGIWYVTSPGSTMVQRSFEDLAVSCEKQGFTPGLAAFKSTTKSMAFGNILFGGVIGAGVDMSTGAAYDYPSLLTVPLGSTSGKVAADTKVASAIADGDVPTLKVGDALEYSIEDLYTRQSRTVVRRVTESTAAGVTFGDGERVEDRKGRLLALRTPVLGDLETFEPPGGWLTSNPRQGHEQQLAFAARDGLVGSPVQIRLRTVQSSSITTPAGTFQAWQIQGEGYATRSASAVPIQHTVKLTLWSDVQTGRPLRFESEIKASGVGSQAGQSSRERTELVRVLRAPG